MPLTLPILDEALFSLPGVNDFKAELSACLDRDCLTITLSLSPEADQDVVAAAAREKLMAISAIRRTQLVIEFPQFGISSIPASGNQKRILSDHRPQSNRRYSG
jgi:hypothetical protein